METQDGGWRAFNEKGLLMWLDQMVTMLSVFAKMLAEKYHNWQLKWNSTNKLFCFQQAKIHKKRQRYNSEGKSESEAMPHTVSASRPRQSSRSPRRSKRSQSSGNLLTLPFENYLEQHPSEEGVMSQARQRYRGTNPIILDWPISIFLVEDAEKLCSNYFDRNNLIGQSEIIHHLSMIQ